MATGIQPHSVPHASSPNPSRPPASNSPQSRSSSNRTAPRVVLALAVCALLGVLAFVLMSGLGSSGDVTKLLTHTVQRSDLVVSVTEQGTLESSSNQEIKCRVKGGSTVLWVVESGTEVQPGDELVRLDQSTIEDNISQQKITYETAVSNKATSESDVAVAKIGVTEYLEGVYRSELALKQKDVVVAESNLKTAQNSLDHAEKMFRKGYTSKLDLEAQRDAVKHAELEVVVKETDLEALEKFTKAKQIETLTGLVNVAEARLSADMASLELESARLERAEDQLKNCVILAETAGLVIHPSAAEWKDAPDIEEGAAVREDQVLLMMPDLDHMQVKVGIHESKVDRVRLDMPARVQLQDGFVDGKVSEIASITKGGGWWTGNVIKYDTMIKLDTDKALKPGMSVAVEVFLAKHSDVLTVPVAAVVELGREFFCWVDKGEEGPPEQRPVKVGDSNDTYIMVTEGLSEGDKVVLNPRDFVDEAHSKSLQSIEERAAPKDVPEFDAKKAEKPKAAGSSDKTPSAKKSK